MDYRSIRPSDDEISYRNLLEEQPITNYVRKVEIQSHFKVDKAFESFVVYNIHVEMSDNNYDICRRFRDFDWLLTYLNEKYPYHILPPLPQKRYIAGAAKFDRRYIDTRMKALEIMLNKLCLIYECLEDCRMKIFLTYNTEKFLEYRFTNSKSNKVTNLSKSIKIIMSDTFLTFQYSKRLDEEMDPSTRQCATLLYYRLTNRLELRNLIKLFEIIEKNWDKYQKISLKLAQELADIYMILNETINCVNSNPHSLCNTELSPVVDKAAQIFFNLSTEAKTHFRTTYEILNPIFKEYLSYDERIIRKLRFRMKVKKALTVKENETKILNAKISENNRDSLPKGNKLDELTRDSLILQDDINKFDKIFYKSYRNWEKERYKEIMTALNSYTYHQISYHRSCLEMCRTFLKDINK